MSEMDDLAAFAVLIEAGSFTVAAEQLGCSKGQLSKRISQLEARFSVVLLHRTTRKLSLTAAGAALLPQAQALVVQVDRARQALARLKDDLAGPVRMTVPVSLGETFFDGLLLEFSKQYPQVQIELELNNSYRDLARDGFDLGVRSGSIESERLVVKPLLAWREMTCASPAYLEKHGVPAEVADLSGHTLLGFTQNEGLNQWPLRYVHGDRWPIQASISASSGETIRHLALEGQGIACLSHYMTIDDIRAGRLQVLLADFNSGYRQPINAVYYRNSQLALRIQCFLDFIQGKLAAYANSDFKG